MPRFTLLDHILGPIGVKYGLRTVEDDNWIDRLSHYYTVVIILFIFVWVVTEEHAGYPIYCWCPAEFSEEMRYYTDYVCWISNTYYIPSSRTIPPQYEKRNTHEITYYQFVPFILLTMAVLFLLPRYFWKYMSQKSGVQIKKMLSWTKGTTWLTAAEREEKLYIVAHYVDSWCSGVNTHRGGIFSLCSENYKGKCSCNFGRHYGNYLVTLAVGVKLWYFLNAIGQLFLLNEFLGGNDFYIYGYEVIYHVFRNQTWPKSNRFPILTLCDFQIRQLNNVQKWTIQCVLPINLYNERFFIFLWFWISIVAILSFLNLIYASFLVWHIGQRRSFAKKYLYMSDIYDKNDFLSRKLVHKFCDKHLRQDGIFLLKMISRESGSVVVTDIIRNLWHIYLERVRLAGYSGIIDDFGNKDSEENKRNLYGKSVRFAYESVNLFPLETSI